MYSLGFPELCCRKHITAVGLAQSVEHLTAMRDVTSSIPRVLKCKWQDLRELRKTNKMAALSPARNVFKKCPQFHQYSQAKYINLFFSIFPCYFKQNLNVIIAGNCVRFNKTTLICKIYIQRILKNIEFKCLTKQEVYSVHMSPTRQLSLMALSYKHCILAGSPFFSSYSKYDLYSVVFGGCAEA